MSQSISIPSKEETMIKQTIQLYLVFSVISQLAIALHSAIYATFLLSRGLNLLEVNLVNVAFFATRFLCEIPTGAFADVFGRKTSFVLSCFLSAAGLVVYAFSGSLPGFVVSEVVLALSMTFSNGAFEAWMVDRLRHHGYDQSLAPVYAREQQLDQGMGIAAGLLGAYLADISFKLPWLFGSVIMFVTGCAAWLVIREEYFIPKRFSFADGFRHIKTVAKDGVRFAFSNKAVRFIIVIMVVQSVALMAPNMQWQPFFGKYFHTKTALGWLWTGMAFSIMLGARLSKRILARYGDEKKVLVWVQVVIGIGVIGAIAFPKLLPALFFFLLHEVARGIFNPIKSSYLQDNIPAAQRATIGSFDSIARHGGGAVGLIATGALAQYGSIPLAWVFAGVVLILGTVAVSRNGWHS